MRVPMRAVRSRAARALGVAGLLLLLPAAVEAQTPTTLHGSVVEAATSAPVAGARVLLPDRGTEARTDPRGRFRVDALPGGAHRVRVEAPGYAAVEARVETSPGTSVEYVFELQPRPLSLEGLTVTATPVPRHLQDFERRRTNHHGSGQFLLRADLERRENSRFSDVLRSLPGLQLAHDFNQGEYHVASGRAQPPGAFLGPPRPCLAQVFVDGVRIYGQRQGDRAAPDPPDVNMFLVRDLDAVEYYANASSTPVEFRTGTATCGTLVLWMRRQ